MPCSGVGRSRISKLTCAFTSWKDFTPVPGAPHGTQLGPIWLVPDPQRALGESLMRRFLMGGVRPHGQPARDMRDTEKPTSGALGPTGHPQSLGPCPTGPTSLLADGQAPLWLLPAELGLLRAQDDGAGGAWGLCSGRGSWAVGRDMRGWGRAWGSVVGPGLDPCGLTRQSP